MSLLKKMALVVIALLAIATVFPSQAATAAPADDEAAFLADINALRASKGLPGFRLNSQLNTMAVNWANQMAANGSISHNPNLAKLGPAGWAKLGENVGVGGDEPSLHRAFVASPGHYANLVDGQFNQIGIAVVYSGGRMWTVHVFMASSVNAPVAAAAPAPVQSEASKYFRSLTERMPAAANIRTLRGRTAIGQ